MRFRDAFMFMALSSVIHNAMVVAGVIHSPEYWGWAGVALDGALFLFLATWALSTAPEHIT